MLALALLHCHAFVTTYSVRGAAPFSYTWDLPANASSSDGLGGSLTFAVSERFCDELLPQFEESSPLARAMLGGHGLLVGCRLLRAALRRAFHAWSDHHPNIAFLDVTVQHERAT